MKIKATRGDADCFLSDTYRNEETFRQADVNLVADVRLVEQNIHMPPLQLPAVAGGVSLPGSSLYREDCLPTDTFHQYCSNMVHGSLNGTDGILAYFLQRIPCASYYHTELGDFYGVPCMMENIPGLVEGCKIYTQNHYCKTRSLPSNNAAMTTQTYDVLISSWARWAPLKVSYYHEKDAKILVLDIGSKLNDFITAVRQLLLSKYTPVAFCRNILVAIQSNLLVTLQDRKDPFPFIISRHVHGYLPLFTNLYMGADNKWYSLEELESEVGKRNFLLKFQALPQSPSDDEWVSAHKRLNKRMIWKPLIADGKMNVLGLV